MRRAILFRICAPPDEASAMASSSSNDALVVEPRMTEGPPRVEPRMTEAAPRTTEEPPRKVQKSRLQQLHSVVGVKGSSMSSILHIVNTLSDQQLGRQKLRDVARAPFNRARRVLALPLAEGGEVSVPVADPSSLVAASVSASETMQAIFKSALQSHPGAIATPWNLLVTWDEFTPGSMHNPNKPKKCMVVNFSFQELGVALHSDRCWWTMAVIRSSILGRVEGGWSRVLRDLLKMTLMGVTGMQRVGIALQIQDAYAVIYGKVGCLLSDGDGLRMALQWMGASSLHPCFRHIGSYSLSYGSALDLILPDMFQIRVILVLSIYTLQCYRHWNVLMKGSGRAEHSDKYVEIGCPCSSKFKTWSNAQLLEAVDVCINAAQQCADGRIRQSRLEAIQRNLGFRSTTLGLLADPTLRARVDFMKVLRYDWAHTFLQEGALGSDVWQLIEATRCACGGVVRPASVRRVGGGCCWLWFCR